MTPVRLRLFNFLSYGTEAPELDFEQFDVACLSGGNGQGKSALLDAITWAIWGEARKSAGAGKPDEELLRTGASRMEVEFEFDQEGTRYRVVRTFARSSTGRTTRPGLDFYVLDVGSGQWNALTSESMRATQAEIDRRVGIDYDTFINSALLLQGRSDEFTRRRPAERKEVLGRILGLDRYERLADAAASRYSAARELARRTEDHVARLRDALQNEHAWRAEFVEVEGVVSVARDERDKLSAEEAGLAARTAALDDQEREAGRRRMELRRLEERGARVAAELDATRSRLEDAQSALERRAEIEAAGQEYDALMLERAELDERREKHRQLTFDLQEARREEETAAAGLNDRLARLRSDEATTRERVAEEDARVAERPGVETQVRAALAAAERARTLGEMRDRRDELAGVRREVQQVIDDARSALQLELIRAEMEFDEVEGIPARLESLSRRSIELAAEVERIQALHRSRDEARAAGTEHRVRRDATLEEVDRLRSDLAAVEERRQKVSSAGDGVCPTCGSRLTEEHRATMVAEYSDEIDAIRSRIAMRDAEAASLREACEKLAGEFQAYEKDIARANGAAGHHAQVVAEVARLEALMASGDERLRRVEELRDRLSSGGFAREDQQRLAEIDREIESIGFDEAAFQEARVEAVRLEALERTLREMDAAELRRAQLTDRLQALLGEIAALVIDIEAGASLRPLREQIERIEIERQAHAFDADADERVRRRLATLADAPAAVVRLATAERDLGAAQARLDELTTEAELCRGDMAETHSALALLAEALAERPALVTGLSEVTLRRRVAEAALEEAQSRLGGLRERLARCDLDRALLKDEQATLKAAKRDAAVSRHLRQAFGAHGIPSLIIEETLPEIEERANDLLGRLTGDRTRVALETHKETRAGGSRDTLEIRITDESGLARPYETYSGGEAFRVNFALRMALAQLLADRAGVRLRTLVVDEGFGTQDQEGRQCLVEAIGVIQADFDKVLVISHLDEIKDAFPVRIEVTKTPLAGSTFAVVGVG